jgi:hypothetical protein
MLDGITCKPQPHTELTRVSTHSARNEHSTHTAHTPHTWVRSGDLLSLRVACMYLTWTCVGVCCNSLCTVHTCMCCIVYLPLPYKETSADDSEQGCSKSTTHAFPISEQEALDIYTAYWQYTMYTSNSCHYTFYCWTVQI